MIKIEYEKDGKLESRQHGTVSGELKEVKIWENQSSKIFSWETCYKNLLLHFSGQTNPKLVTNKIWSFFCFVREIRVFTEAKKNSSLFMIFCTDIS